SQANLARASCSCLNGSDITQHLASQYGQKLADNLHVFQLFLKHDVVVAEGIGLRFQPDTPIDQLAILFDFLALVQLYRVTATMIGILNRAMLHQNYPALPTTGRFSPGTGPLTTPTGSSKASRARTKEAKYARVSGSEEYRKQPFWPRVMRVR